MLVVGVPGRGRLLPRLDTACDADDAFVFHLRRGGRYRNVRAAGWCAVATWAVSTPLTEIVDYVAAAPAFRA
jgi:hypothetical protein